MLTTVHDTEVVVDLRADAPAEASGYQPPGRRRLAQDIRGGSAEPSAANSTSTLLPITSGLSMVPAGGAMEFRVDLVASSTGSSAASASSALDPRSGNRASVIRESSA
jgi:hypothetical protein